jgi:hypothetical protein
MKKGPGRIYQTLFVLWLGDEESNLITACPFIENCNRFKQFQKLKNE